MTPDMKRQLDDMETTEFWGRVNYWLTVVVCASMGAVAGYVASGYVTVPAGTGKAMAIIVLTMVGIGQWRKRRNKTGG